MLSGEKPSEVYDQFEDRLDRGITVSCDLGEDYEIGPAKWGRMEDDVLIYEIKEGQYSTEVKVLLQENDQGTYELAEVEPVDEDSSELLCRHIESEFDLSSGPIHGIHPEMRK